jgi:two-component system, cell cycle sensor histidine kinase and response regulator CckA
MDREDEEARQGGSQEAGSRLLGPVATYVAARDVFVVCDDEERIVLAGRGVGPMFGWAASDLAGRRLDTILPDGWRDAREVVARRRDGREVEVGVTAEAVVSVHGALELLTLRDAREHRGVQQRLERRETALSAVLEGLPDATVAARPDGRIVFANPKAEELFGYDREELLGRQVQALWPERVRERYARNMELYFATEDPLRFTSEAYGLRRDGSEFVGEMSWGIVETDEGPLLLAIGRDISQRLETLATVRRQSDQQAAVAALGERALAGASLADLGREAVERIRDTLLVDRVTITRRGKQEALASWGRAVAPRSVLRVEMRSGREVVGTLSVAAAREDAFGEAELTFLKAIANVLAMAVARLQGEEQLRQAQKMEAVGQLAGGVAHDFNNLLTVISGYGRIARQRVGVGPGSEELVEIAHAAERATQLTQQLLAFSRQQVLEPTVLDLGEVARGLAPMLGRLIGEDVQMAMLAEERLPSVLADRGQMSQIILNLAVNARDAMPTGGTLTIETRTVDVGVGSTPDGQAVEPGRYVCLSVSDTGIGMEPEVLEHAFEPFFTTKDAGQGTGLGLATVHGIVTQSGGFLTVKSVPGLGTSFTILLPPVELPAEAAAAAEPREPDTLTGTETVLLCEDEDAVRRLTERALRSGGYQLLVAARPSEALELAAAHDAPIHALVTDVIMPEISGPELSERLLATRPDLRTLFVSGYAAETLERRGGLPAGSAFLAKPFEPEVLLGSLRELLDQDRTPGGSEAPGGHAST